MLRVVLGAILVGVVQMICGMIFWGISPLGDALVQGVPGEDAVVAVLNEHLPETGDYFYPNPHAMKSSSQDVKSAVLKACASGPLIQISYRKEGFDGTSPMQYIIGYCHFVGGGLLVGTLLFLALPGLNSYLARVAFVSLAGIFAAFAISLSDPIWLHNPWKFALQMAGFHVAGWVFSALVLALVVTKRPA
jgi:hypothetical protein